jgi:hypothetical protein
MLRGRSFERMIEAVTRLFAACLALPLVGLASCGPSFQAIYEGDLRFEHCYAVDESASVPLQQKEECWRDWTKNYTYGQTRDRIEYAVSRRLALSRVNEMPTDDAMMQAAPGEGIRRNVISAPMPTSAFAAPPNTMPEPSPVDATSHPKASEGPKPFAVPQLRAPGTECTDECTKTWQGCKAGCAGSSCDTCDATYKGCAMACYKDLGRGGGPAKPRK